MNSGSTCKDCGTVIPADSAGGWCPQCLLGLGLQETQRAESRERSQNEKDQPAGSDANATDVSQAESADRIGRYRLLKELGHGGCGVVYQAEQDQPVRRNVALKVIKLGMDTRQVVARFEAEKQALALMDHPSIAKVIEGGTIGDTDSLLSSRNPQ